MFCVLVIAFGFALVACDYFDVVACVCYWICGVGLLLWFLCLLITDCLFCLIYFALAIR